MVGQRERLERISVRGFGDYPLDLSTAAILTENLMFVAAVLTMRTLHGEGRCRRCGSLGGLVDVWLDKLVKNLLEHRVRRDS